MKLSIKRKTYKTNYTILLLLCSFFIFTHSIITQARVFQRWNYAANSNVALESAGGKQAYTAPITLNGGNGTLSIYGFNDNISTVTANLCRIFNIPHSGIKNNGVILSDITNKQTVISFIILNIQNSTRVFSFTQSIKEARKSKHIQRNPLRDLPAYPGAEPSFYARDNKTKAALFTSSTRDNSSNILSFYHSELENDGWTQPLASSQGRNPTGNLLFYVKNNKICCIFVSQSYNRQKTDITILYKELINNEK